MRIRFLGGIRAWGSEAALPGASGFQFWSRVSFSESHGYHLCVILEHVRNITDHLMKLNAYLIQYRIIYVI